MANTTNLNLAKPGLDDDALITDINNNMDKIDTWAGTTNTAITEVRSLESLGSVASQSALETALDTKLAAMSNYTSIVARVVISTAFGSFSKTTYVCRLSKPSTTTNSTALFESLTSSADKDLIKGTKSTSWRFDLMVRESDIYYKAGDTASSQYYVTCAGFVSESSKRLVFYLPLEKNLPTNRSLTFTSLQVVARGTSGYVDIFTATDHPDIVGNSGYTIMVDPRGTYGTGIRIDKPSAMTNVTNNTPVAVQVIYTATVS